MTILLGTLGAVVALILAYFIAGNAVADWLDRECDKMEAQARGEWLCGRRCCALGLHAEADWHYGNSDILVRNVRACKRVARWLR